MRESGLDFEGNIWTRLYVPKGAPSPIIDKLYSALSTIPKSDEIKKCFAGLGYDTNQLGLSPAELGAYHRARLAKWKKTNKDYGITPTKQSGGRSARGAG